jgi:isopentenyl diphosphate isomerase/L-lactate dehydrogenase-like FMN-dependent dehydrogenase
MTRSDRRRFLRLLAASPLAARVFAQEPAKFASAKDVLAAMDLEDTVRRALPPAHWGYMASGVDDDLTLRANIGAFQKIGLRPRRLVDVSATDLHVQVFGETWETPLYISAVGGQRMFHPDGELATARAARAKKTVQMLSTQSSVSVEDVAKALGTPPWYQLYIPARWDQTEKLVRRVEAAGCKVLVWTVDLLAGRNTATATRGARLDTRDCDSCHLGRVKPMLEGIEGTLNPPAATWEWVDRLKKMTSMKLVLKGLDGAADAKLAVEHGADGIVVSNHGGRSTETLRPTIECLPEVVDAVGGRIPVFVDGGFRRGSDVYKALSLGARAVGLGRAYIYGLTAFGQEGVERILDLMREELTRTMQQCGTPSIARLTRETVILPSFWR